MQHRTVEPARLLRRARLWHRLSVAGLTLALCATALLFAAQSAHAASSRPQSLDGGGGHVLREHGCHHHVAAYIMVGNENTVTTSWTITRNPIPIVSKINISYREGYRICQRPGHDWVKAKYVAACYTFHPSLLHPQEHHYFAGVRVSFLVKDYRDDTAATIRGTVRIHDDNTVHNCSRRHYFEGYDDEWVPYNHHPITTPTARILKAGIYPDDKKQQLIGIVPHVQRDFRVG